MKEIRTKSEYDLNIMPYNRHLRYEGKYYGIINDVADPNGSGAVKVYIPELMQGLPSSAGIWALRLFQVEGLKSTLWYNQWVQIEFKEGNPNMPIVVGVLKHFDEAPTQVNPKTWKWPNPQQLPENPAQADKKYASTFRKTKMSDKDAVTGSKSHVLYTSPRLGHTIRVSDTEEYSFIELQTNHGTTFTMCDTFDYALLHVVSTDQPENDEYAQDLMMSGMHQYVDLASSTYWAFHADGKRWYTIVRSRFNFLFMIDIIFSAFMVSGFLFGAMVGGGPEVIWQNATDRWAPYTKVKSKSLSWSLSQLLLFFAKRVNANVHDGATGTQFNFNGQATYISTSFGFIFLNSYWYKNTFKKVLIMKNKDVLNQALKDAKKQLQYYVKLTHDSKFKPVPRQLKFNNKLNKNFYEKTKELVIESYKQYYIGHKLVQNAKKKNILIKEKAILEFDKMYLIIKNKILPKFKNDIEFFASYVAYEKMLTASLHKGALNKTYELTLKQLEYTKKANKELVKTLKKIAPDLKLEETNDLTEANIKEALKAPFKLLKKAFLTSMKIMIEGWIFVLKGAKAIAMPIKKKIDGIFRKLDEATGRVAKNIIKSINPDFIQTIEQFGGSAEELEWIIGGYIRRGVLMIIGSFSFGAASLILLQTANVVVNKIIAAGEYAELGDFLMQLMKISDMSDLEDDLINL